MKDSIIEVKNLTFSFENQENLFEDTSFNIETSDLIAIIGANGIGKSTLIKLIINFLKPKKGKIITKGKISYIPQKFNQDNNFPAKVRELLDLECCDCSLRKEIVKSLGIDNLLEKQFKNLSGGQQQRVFITLSLLSNPDILILDEPTVGVDTQTQIDFYKLLKSLNEKRKLTILFITHDTGMVSNYFNKIICIDNKKVYIENAEKTNEFMTKKYAKNFNQVIHTHHKHTH